MSRNDSWRGLSRSRGRGARVLIMLGMVGLALVMISTPWPVVTQAQDGVEPTTVIPPEYAAQIPSTIRRNLLDLAGASAVVSARALLATQMGGKEITVADESQATSPKKLLDVPVGEHPTKHENEPTVAVNPVDKKKLVAGSHFSGLPPPTTNFCVAYTSSDRGESWSGPVQMPHLTPLSACSDPVLAYAPDGSRVYYSYMDIKQIFVDPPGPPPPTLTIDFDIVISYSDDDGDTWTGPIVALNGAPTIVTFNPPPAPPTVVAGFEYDKNWHGTHIDASESNRVYLTATRFDESPPFACHIAFTRSSDQGQTWSAPILLDSSGGGCGVGANPLVQGSRPTGGVGGEVLVAWFNSGADGWLTGGFQIRTRRSGNFGGAFDPAVVAASDSFELPFWLGPFVFYHRWWGGMFPDVEIDPGGNAHIVYTHDPAANPIPGFSDTAEDGDVRYVTSQGAPYGAGSWSAPETVNDDGLVRAQGYAAMETDGGGSSHVHVIWEDHRLSLDVPAVFPNSSNLFYDIFYSRKTPGNSGWRPNSRVTEASSINDFIFIGDYNDLAISNKVFAIFTDRRHRTSIFELEDNVFGSLITPHPKD